MSRPQNNLNLIQTLKIAKFLPEKAKKKRKTIIILKLDKMKSKNRRRHRKHMLFSDIRVHIFWSITLILKKTNFFLNSMLTISSPTQLNLNSFSTKLRLNLISTSGSNQPQPQLNRNHNLNSIWLWHKSNPILLLYVMRSSWCIKFETRRLTGDFRVSKVWN